MPTALITHPDCHNHVTPPGHPEQVARLGAVLDAVADLDLIRVEAPMAEDAMIRRAHPQTHIDHVAGSEPAVGFASLDADTHLTSGSVGAARRAVGGAALAVDMVLAGDVANVFVATRPPGHHAERETAMGFCLFGNVAIAAKYALDHHGLSRVAILDFDVHHGNGTQDIVQDDPRICFVSSHQMPLYPGTGDPSETGVDGNVLNIALHEGTGSAGFRQAWEDHGFPAVAAHRPELILMSAGFDAHAADPLAGLNVQTEDFAWITGRICDLAAEFCAGRVVSALEGGYDLPALGDSVRAHVTTLIGRGA